jgi:hypothetical protein
MVTESDGGDDIADIRDARVAAAAISGQSVGEIAASENVSERQIYRVLAKPGVRAAIEKAAREMVRSAELVLRSGASAAARTLVAFASGELKAPASVRLSAASKIVDVTEAHRTLDEIDERLTQLEARGLARRPS